MPAVTQLTPNFLGGVSRQNDDKKLEGQLTDCVNGYPDPTFGLLKRPGMRYISNLKKANGDVFTKAELADAAWFYIDRAAAGSYVGCIKGADIFVWTTDDGTFCTVTNTGASYLTGTTQNDYHFRSIQDTTIITNKTVTTAMQTAGTHIVGSVATLKLLSLTVDDEFVVIIEGQPVTVTAQNTTTFDDMLLYTTTPSSEIEPTHHLIDGVKDLIETQQTAANADFDGTWYLEGYNNSIVIRRTDATPNAVVTDYSVPTGNFVGFNIDARGGLANTALEIFEDDVVNFAKLPLESFGGHTVKILNSGSNEDDYYVKFVAYDTTINRGRGFWQETLSPTASPGLLASTMPHRLSNTGATTFTFEPIPWADRLAGDDVTNPQPSFIGKKLTSSFFYSNRFGFLAEDNVILGVSNDAYNFFSKSALTQIDSDPIDLNVSSVRPVTLSDVLPSPQGLLLFSERQQFQLFATDASVLTPASSLIRTLSNYEMATDIAPVDVGTTSAFVARVPGYSKLFTMVLRDVEQSPIVVDISKAVLEWIPDTVDSMTASPPNSVVMLVDRSTSYLYLYRYYNNGEKDLFQAWTKWKLPGTIEATKIINDNAVVVQQHEDEYMIGSIELDEIPQGSSISDATTFEGNACLDMATRPLSPAVGVSAVVYELALNRTKIYVPYKPISGKKGAILFNIPRANVATGSSENGFWAEVEGFVEPGTGYYYFEIQGDFTEYADGMLVGYNYELDVTLPKFYYRLEKNTVDYTATLTISRVIFSLGRTGIVKFKSKASGSNEWVDVQHVAEAGYYQSGNNPVEEEKTFTVPIHQRNTNFELKVTSDYPYPVSLVSMMWEGNYSPRFYRRT